MVALFVEPVVLDVSIVEEQVEVVRAYVLVELFCELVLVFSGNHKVCIVLGLYFCGLYSVVVCVKEVLDVLLGATHPLLIYELLVRVICFDAECARILLHVGDICVVIGAYLVRVARQTLQI